VTMMINYESFMYFIIFISYISLSFRVERYEKEYKHMLDRLYVELGLGCREFKVECQNNYMFRISRRLGSNPSKLKFFTIEKKIRELES